MALQLLLPDCPVAGYGCLFGQTGWQSFGEGFPQEPSSQPQERVRQNFVLCILLYSCCQL